LDSYINRTQNISRKKVSIIIIIIHRCVWSAKAGGPGRLSLESRFSGPTLRRASRSFPQPANIPPDPTRFCIRCIHTSELFFTRIFYLSIFFSVLAHTMRNKNRAQTAKPHTREKTHTHTQRNGRTERRKWIKACRRFLITFPKAYIPLLMRCPNGSRLIYSSRPLLIINFIVRLALQHTYYILVYAQLFILSSARVSSCSLCHRRRWPIIIIYAITLFVLWLQFFSLL